MATKFSDEIKQCDSAFRPLVFHPDPLKTLVNAENNENSSGLSVQYIISGGQNNVL